MRWKDLYDGDQEWRRTPRVSDEDVSVQPPSTRREERRDERRKERERERERELKPRMRSRRSSHEDASRRAERDREIQQEQRRGGSSFREREEGSVRRGGGLRDRRPPSPPGVRVVDGTHSRRGASPVRAPDGSIRGVDGRRYPSGHGHGT